MKEAVFKDCCNFSTRRWKAGVPSRGLGQVQSMDAGSEHANAAAPFRIQVLGSSVWKWWPTLWGVTRIPGQETRERRKASHGQSPGITYGYWVERTEGGNKWENKGMAGGLESFLVIIETKGRDFQREHVIRDEDWGLVGGRPVLVSLERAGKPEVGM